MTPEDLKTPETPEAPETQPAPETLMVSDLDQFVKLLVGWHNQQVKTVEHFLTVPDGMVMQLGDDPEITLTGDALVAFKAGVNLALTNLGTLPFKAELEEAADPAPEASAPDVAPAN